MRIKYLSSIITVVLLLLAGIAWHQHSLPQSSPRIAKKISVLPYLQAMQAKKGIPAMKKSSSPLRAIPLKPSPLDHPSEEELQFFPGATVVISAEVTGPDLGQTTRLRILKVHGKYPMLRTEEVVDDASKSLVTRSEMAADHLLVTLAAGEDPETLLKKMGPQAIAITRVTSGTPLYRVDLASASLEALPQGLDQSSIATKGIGEPDFVVRLSTAPNNIYYKSNQWAFWDSHTSGDDHTVYHGISAEEAWDIRTDASSVIVGVIDSGIRYTHQSLAPNMWHNPNPSAAGDIYGWNAYDNNGLTTIQLAAPGDEIYSTWNDSNYSYGYMSGTSCAAPFVTGALALLKAQFPQEPYQALIARLLHSVDQRPEFDKKTVAGGALNIAKALLGPTPSPRSYYYPSESWSTFFDSWME